jgi:Heparinase II/III-like protein/Heparinase II/III N-terminus
MTSPLHKAVTGARLTRALGPRWVAQRAVHAARLHNGALQRELPLMGWDEVPLVSALSDPTLASPETYLAFRRQEGPQFFFDPASRVGSRGRFASWDEVASPVAEADGICEGTIRYFSRTTAPLGDPPDWHRDPFTGETWPADEHFADSDEYGRGDIKVIWEAGRFGFVYPLVRAYWRTGDERFADAFWRLFESWRAANPPNHGPNWKSGQETSFRVMAWSFALYGFFLAEATTPERMVSLTEAIAFSGHRIEVTLHDSLSAQNNHGIGDAMGLWTIGALFPEFQKADRWREIGRGVLERLGRNLIYGDGSFSRHSLNDHRSMLDAYVWSIRLGEIVDQAFSRVLVERVGRAADFLYQLQDEATGRVPCYGANDGSMILPLTNCDYQDFRQVVQATRYLTTRTRTFEAGPWDEKLYWLFGNHAVEAEAVPSPRVDFQARDGGYFTLRSEAGFAFVRSAEFRHPPSHADQLHVDLWWRGINIALDPGTSSFNAPMPWNHALAPTIYHNTVSVDLRSQMDQETRFLFLPWSRGVTRRVARAAAGNIAYWEGSHDGYLRLTPGASHRRAVVKIGNEHWVVLDEVRSREPHICRLHWLLADWPYEMNVRNQQNDLGEAVTLRLETPTGPFAVHAQTRRAPARVSLVRADPFSARGWRSAYYQHKEPALSLSLTREAAIVRFCTVFGPDGYEVEISPGLIHLQYTGVDAKIVSANDGRLLVSAVTLDGPDSDRLDLPR